VKKVEVENGRAMGERWASNVTNEWVGSGKQVRNPVIECDSVGYGRVSGVQLEGLW
jgi:hypothetical protein